MSSICFVSYYSYALLFPESTEKVVGGAEVQQHHLAAALDRIGVRVSFVVGKPPGARPSAHPRYEVHRSYDPTRGLPFLRSLYPQFVETWRAMRRADSEIYYVRGARIESVVAWLFCKVHRRRYVAAIAHDRECDPETLPFPRWKPRHPLFLRSLGGASVVLAQTESQKATLARTLQIDAAVVKNLVPEETIAAPEPGPLESILWVGSIRPSKRPEMLLGLAGRFPMLAFTMIGPVTTGHREYREGIRARARELPNVTFIDHVPIDEIGAHFRACDLLVATSQSEGFPNVLLQAWSAGRPVLTAFDPDGIVGRHRLGLVARELADLEASLGRLRSQDGGSELLEMGRNGRAYVARHHTPDRILPEFCARVGIRDARCGR